MLGGRIGEERVALTVNIVSAGLRVPAKAILTGSYFLTLESCGSSNDVPVSQETKQMTLRRISSRTREMVPARCRFKRERRAQNKALDRKS